MLRQHDSRWTVDRRREVDRGAVCGHGRILVLHQRFQLSPLRTDTDPSG